MLPTEGSIERSGSEQKQICKFYSLNRWCRYGNSCIYQHERYTNRPRFQRYNNTDIPPPSRTNRQEITDVHLGSRLPPDKQDVATTTSSIHTSYRKSTENNGQFCRFYRQNSWCPFGFGCRFVHERHSSWRGSNKEKRWGSSSFQSSIPKSKESRRVCDYFKRGKCHYGENCKYEHLRDLQVEQGRVECDNGKLELQSSETCDVLEELVVPVEDDKEKATVVVKPESLKHGIDVIDLNDADLQKLRYDIFKHLIVII